MLAALGGDMRLFGCRLCGFRRRDGDEISAKWNSFGTPRLGNRPPGLEILFAARFAVIKDLIRRTFCACHTMRAGAE
jgi:hypothetical protein